MTLHMNNAVAHYAHLLEQGVEPDKALAHTRQQFGISTSVLIARLAGDVAKSKDTQAALANAREYLTGSERYELDYVEDLLAQLYSAITGEKLT